MRAKDLADLAGTTVRTIRYYHQEGLLPIPPPGTSWRSYGFAHLTRLMRIRWLVESGIPLAEVRHMLPALGHGSRSADELALVEDDLQAVLAVIDGHIAALEAQRARVATLLGRVRTEGRLSPLPPAVVLLYARLLDRPLPQGMRSAVLRERDLLELACYRGPLPSDLERLLQAVNDSHVDRLCTLWEDVFKVNEQACADGGALTDEMRGRIDDVVARTFALVHEIDADAAAHLLARAPDLERPVVRAAIRLAYPTASYDYLMTAVVLAAANHEDEVLREGAPR